MRLEPEPRGGEHSKAQWRGDTQQSRDGAGIQVH